jgi:hypothetical protein
MLKFPLFSKSETQRIILGPQKKDEKENNFNILMRSLLRCAPRNDNLLYEIAQPAPRKTRSLLHSLQIQFFYEIAALCSQRKIASLLWSSQ